MGKERKEESDGREKKKRIRWGEGFGQEEALTRNTGDSRA